MSRTVYTLVVIVLIAFAIGCSDNKPGAPAVPIITLSSDSLEFNAAAGGSNPPEQSVYISNTGVGEMTFQATSPVDWIVALASPTVNTGSVVVRVSTIKVPAGTNIDSVAVTSAEAGNSPQYIKVVFLVSKTISANPGSLVFSAVSEGQNPELQYFNIVNEGGGYMTFSATKSAAWLSLSPTSGTAPDSIGVSVDITGLAAGIYTDSITVSSPEATNDSIIVGITLTVSSWTPSNDGIAPVHELQGLSFSGNSVGWVVGFVPNAPEHAGAVFKSIDGGRTWTNQLTQAGTSFGDIAFVNESFGCVVGDGAVIMITNDGGDTWDMVDGLPVDSTHDLWTVAFANNERGLAVGNQGTILLTVDSGLTWAHVASPTDLSLSTIAFAGEMNAWIAGNHGNILHTIDGGATWEFQTSPTQKDLWGIAFTDANTGWIVGDSGIMVTTTNGGSTWETATHQTDQKLQDIFFLDASHGWAVGRSGTIIHTSDGGATWLPQFAETEQWLFGVHFFDLSTGLVVGYTGTVLRTENGGF